MKQILSDDKTDRNQNNKTPDDLQVLCETESITAGLNVKKVLNKPIIVSYDIKFRTQKGEPHRN